ncbi:GNAT family N-acetyltransferase [Komarekiella sp. 'clone 1']|uniref:GNAT family N-acetyltransferase n=1 Tax=Komarekiella delphini-convector SJRDD-AB1 TaxID=2593771 RepID=A0AA40VQC1_9NOST|nr:GNAT family N-acetyltransferase [Komarekiella delphini-convector]MBD6615016.1 GNAT family N-acetyltransferase [Komarekiella delphini-convector SJRDD-AB1]
MLTEKHIIIREATTKEDSLIAKHFYQMWLDIGVHESNIHLDWQNITRQFIEESRRDLFYKAFIAEIDNTVVGSASCQLFAGLYPIVFKDEYRKFGYIWGVYVEQSYRRQGIAKCLTNQAIEYLKVLGCTRVVLNASPSGKPVYSSLGFSEGNLMQLDLI